jgi:hypothetical protein
MDDQLLVQLKSWNPWWQQGMAGIDRYKDPIYKREMYAEIKNQFFKGEQIVSIVGMRQIGKSTIMRQIIKELLQSGVDPKRILYVSFDDPYLRTTFDQKQIFNQIIKIYSTDVLQEELIETSKQLYFFFDEIHQLPQWEKVLKTFHDRPFQIKYLVSGSSSLRIQQKNRESLLGRISEHTLWPFSFREYLDYKEQGNKRIGNAIIKLWNQKKKFISSFALEGAYKELKAIHQELSVWEKQKIVNYLKKFIIEGGFPRVWQQDDIASKQRTLWEHHIAKVLFEDLPQVAKIRKVKDLETLYVRLVDFNGSEAVLSKLQKDMRIHWETLDRYLNYLQKTFLLFRIDRTKTKRFDHKRRSGNIKFYVTDVALRNALRKKTEEIFDNPEEMSYVAENLVCTTVESWFPGIRRDGEVSFYRDKTGEVDFIAKYPAGVLPVEVKWRNDVPALKTLDKLCARWEASESILITKDFDFSFKNGRLSVPLWFFLLAF